MLDKPPVRLCCSSRHYGCVCPDGKVMCIICYNRVTIDKLHLLPNGKREDVCQSCADKEKDPKCST